MLTAAEMHNNPARECVLSRDYSKVYITPAYSTGVDTDRTVRDAKTFTSCDEQLGQSAVIPVCRFAVNLQ